MSDARPATEGAGPDHEPRRLHPATALIAVIRGTPSTLLGVPALLAVGARAELWLVLAGTAAALLAAGVIRWIAWSRFTYALTPDAVVIESGLLSRNRRTIPYERLADVGIERRPLQRLFGLASVTLETGGAGADEGKLDSVSVAEAERLRDALRRRRATVGRPAPMIDIEKPGSDVPSIGMPLFAMDTRRVLISGLFNFSLVWIAIGFGTLQYLARPLGIDQGVLWDAVAARTGAVRSLSVLAWAGAVAAAAVVVVVVGVLAGIVRTTLRDHGFQVTHEGGRLRRVRGLFTRSEAIIPLSRIQLAAIDDGPLRRLFGWSRLRAQVLGGEDAGGRQDLAPLARPAEIECLLRTLRLDRSTPEEMQPVARGHVWRALLRKVGPPALLVVAASVAAPTALLASPLLLPLIVAAMLERRHHRWRLAAGSLQIRRGVLGRTTWIVPVTRVQATTLRRSWLQRRLRLATVLVDVAGGGRSDGPVIYDLREADAWSLMASLRRA